MADAAPFDPSLDGLGYAEAVAELEQILEQLDGDEVDVDHLATQVRRAAELIAFCRSRLSAARMEVTRVVADLDTLATLAVSTGSTNGDAAGEAGRDADEVASGDDGNDEDAGALALDDALLAEGDG